MKQFLTTVIISLLILTTTNNSQVSSQEKWYNGFAKYIYGENLNYHSCHQEATLGLLIRSQKKTDYIEWETDSVSLENKSKEVTFVWIGGYSTGTSTANHKFFLSFNGKQKLFWNTKPKQEAKDWYVEKDGVKLSFKFARLDQHNDHFGYFSLTIPTEMLDGKRTARIKVEGDATGSNDWYMTMQYPLVPKLRITSQKIVLKNSSGKNIQQIKVSIDHFDLPIPVEINSENNSVKSQLTLGMNDFFLDYDAPTSESEKSITISYGGNTKTYAAKILPARKITFYLIPHGHVDIGYTELQTEVEKKHWQNFDNAIRYSKHSANYDEGSVFKWNVEVLWAVKSYLEKFPERKKDFFEAVKRGWIGLDATYDNIQTALCRPEELYRWNEYSNLLEKEIGVKIESAMISDIPGYTWGVVPTFADNGIKYFSVGTNEFDRIGNTLSAWGDKPYYWQSPSGQNKILIWLAGKGYSWFNSWRLTREDITPIVKYLDKLDEEKYPYDIVHMRYSIGGDNGYPDSTLSDFIQKWNATHETPKFKIATTKELFEDLEKKYQSKIPTYSGDFTPTWEDGAGSSAKETALNRQSAEMLTQLETLYTLNDYKNFPHEKFDEAWRYVLLYSEHTWGAWNSISEPELKSVKDQWEIKRSYAIKADSITKDLWREIVAGKQLTNYEFTVCNSSSWNRTQLISIPNGLKIAHNSIVDEKGKQVPTQKLSNGDLVFIAKDVPAFGFKRYKLSAKTDKPNNKGSENKNTLENDEIKIVINENSGAIESLSNKKTKQEFVDKNKYMVNEYIYTGQNGENPRTNSRPSIRVIDDGEIVKTVSIVSEAPGTSLLTREIKLVNGSNYVEIVNTIDKYKNYRKENLRFAFPFNVEQAETKIDLAWSVIRPEIDQLAGSNKNYFTVQRWVDVSNKEKGITLATVDAPFIEVGGMNAESWMSSPNKIWADKAESSSLLFSWVMNNSWHTNFKASQEGIASFKYALLPHKEFNYTTAYQFGVEQSQPMILSISKNVLKNKISPIELIKNEGLVITSLKTSRNKKGIIARVYNPSGKELAAQIKTSYKIFVSNGDEEKLSELPNKLSLKQFEVKTLFIEM